MKRTLLILAFLPLFISNIISQSISTNGEIYNFDIGDVFHYSHIMSNPSGGSISESNIIITAKYYSSNNDTIFYIRDIKSKSSSSFNPTPVFENTNDTIAYSNLDSTVNNGIIDSVYYDTLKYNGHKINRDTTSFGAYFADSLGVVYMLIYNKPITLTYDEVSLVYYKKGNDEWGIPIPLSISSNDDAIYLIKLFPNPATSQITIEFDKQISNCEIIIINIFGQEIIHHQLDGNTKYSLNISELKSGMYFYSIVSDGNILKSDKFIKQ